MTERDTLLHELARAPARWHRASRFRASAVTEDGPEAVRRSGLCPTHTPTVLIAGGSEGR
ncbi:hypothetical protein [Streptomyces sp. W1SF4]|uniref:hypothetical protein n=1 Tax=Streptomyces sp. W1SF4 TaxID=2305220 RepID=UPI000F6D3B6F|nr:hypothetical protein [Streptomyces sp. W1SF4]AZM93737.1 hypothetical protein D1J60_34970 [Streptomyces sp. W1SF4]